MDLMIWLLQEANPVCRARRLSTVTSEYFEISRFENGANYRLPAQADHEFAFA